MKPPSEEHYRFLFDHMLGGFAYCRMIFVGGQPHDFTYLEVNPAFESLVGRTDVTGKNASEVTPSFSESDQDFLEICGRVSQGGVPGRFEIHVQALDAWFAISIYSPRREHFVAIFDVITSRKRAEKALREREARYRGLFEANPHPMWVFDVDTLRFLEVNDAAVARYGYSRDEFLRMTAADIRPPEEVSRLRTYIADNTDPSLKSAGLWKHRTSDGRIIDVEVSAQALDYDGRAARLVLAQDVTERKRIEQSQARLVAILEATTDLVSIADPMGRLQYINPAGRRICGLTDDADLTTCTINDFLPGGPSSVIASEGLPTAIARGIWSGESELVSLDGRAVSISQIILAHKSPDGSVEFLSTIARDVTEKKQTDEALRASEARHRRLLDSNIIGVVFWNAKGDILDANELFLKMIGYTRDDLQEGLRWDALTPADCGAADAKALAELHETGSCEPFEKDFIRKDGSRVTVMVGSALLNHGSDLGSSFVMDITERKQAETRLRLQSAALNAAANAMIITDRDGTIVWANPAFTDLTGYSTEEAIGRNPRHLVRSGVHDAAFFKDMWETILGGESWTGEIRNRRKDGDVYPEHQTITPVKDHNGQITHFIAIKSDLTKQRLMEAQLRQAQKMEAVGQLAGGVAHEFNNLLQALMTMAGILGKSDCPPEVSKIGAEIESLIKRGASVTQQLLVFSRRKAMEKAVFDLADLIRKGTVLLRRLIPENIGMTVETDPERMAVEGDAAQIQQVLMNLAINARDAMPTGGALTVRVRRNPSEVLLEVEDTGEGMDESVRGRIFEPFFTTKEVGKGTGLGLAVVHGIVEQHKGRIEVESAPGAGSKFRIFLPAVVDRTDLAEDKEEMDTPAGNGARVLVVEDESGVREGIVMLLEVLGYEVKAVGSGEEAIELPAETAPDLLLSDVTLPGMAGAELARRLKQRWPDLGVILMSGYFENEAARAENTNLGGRFLQKPFDMGNLARHLRGALDDRAARVRSDR